MSESAKVILKIEEYNNKEVRSKKEEERRKNALTGGPSGLASRSTSSSGTSSPELLPTAKEETCVSIREGVMSSRPLLTDANLSYIRLSLLDPNADSYDGSTYTRMKSNMDVSFNNDTNFKKFVWRLTSKRSEFYANLPKDWATDSVYGGAWDYYNSLPTKQKWIGKATYRLPKRAGRSSAKMKMVPLFAMVMWSDNDSMQYQMWLEDAVIPGVFDIEKRTKYYTAASNPVNNFQPTGFQALEL